MLYNCLLAQIIYTSRRCLTERTRWILCHQIRERRWSGVDNEGTTKSRTGPVIMRTCSPSNVPSYILQEYETSNDSDRRLIIGIKRDNQGERQQHIDSKELMVQQDLRIRRSAPVFREQSREQRKEKRKEKSMQNSRARVHV